MKHAVHCGFCSMPTLNQTGELNAIWWTRRLVSSSGRRVEVRFGREVAPPSRPQPVIVLNDPADELAHGRLAVRVPDVAAKVLGRRLGRHLRPELRISTSFCSKTISPVSGSRRGRRCMQVTRCNGGRPGGSSGASQRQALGRLAGGELLLIEARPIRAAWRRASPRPASARRFDFHRDLTAVRSGHLRPPHLIPR